MLKVGSVYVGWVDTTIGALMGDKPDFFARFPWALVTCVDSSTDVSALPSVERALAARHVRKQSIDGSILLSGAQLVEVAAAFKLVNGFDLFNGFDEVWLSYDLPAHAPPPEMSITGPVRITEDIPEGVVDWMSVSGCILGLGDGTGLNYITVEPALGHEIETDP